MNISNFPNDMGGFLAFLSGLASLDLTITFGRKDPTDSQGVLVPLSLTWTRRLVTRTDALADLLSHILREEAPLALQGLLLGYSKQSDIELKVSYAHRYIMSPYRSISSLR